MTHWMSDQRRPGWRSGKTFSPAEWLKAGTKFPAMWKMLKQWVASREVTKNTESWLLLPRGKKIWRQDGGMEHNTRKTLPERSQRDYWELNTKNKNSEPTLCATTYCKDRSHFSGLRLPLKTYSRHFFLGFLASGGSLYLTSTLLKVLVSAARAPDTPRFTPSFPSFWSSPPAPLTSPPSVRIH